MPTHEDLPDPEAWWRLTGDEDVAPAGLQRPTRRYDAIVVVIIVAIVGVMAIDIAGADPLYGAAAWFYAYMESAPSFPWFILFIFVGGYPVIMLHELGHAFAARALLGTPVHVAVGSFGEIARVRLGEISMSLSALASPAGVQGSATFDASRATARDVLLIALAGPAASACGLVASVSALAALPSSGFLHGLVWAAVAGSIWCILNLIPFKLVERPNEPAVQSDGRVALDAARVMHSLR